VPEKPPIEVGATLSTTWPTHPVAQIQTLFELATTLSSAALPSVTPPVAIRHATPPSSLKPESLTMLPSCSQGHPPRPHVGTPHCHCHPSATSPSSFKARVSLLSALIIVAPEHHTAIVLQGWSATPRNPPAPRATLIVPTLQCYTGDEDITTSDTTIPSIELQGPIMRSQAQQLRH
jgi:hypothetical protein